MNRLLGRRATATALGITAAIGLAACGGSSGGKSAVAGPSLTNAKMSASASSGYAAAQADFKKWLTPQGLQGLTPIGKKIPTGKSIDFVICSPAECVPPSTDFTQAASLLGWHVKTIDAGLDPGSNQAAMQETVRDHPSAVIYEGISSSVFQPQLKALKAAHIPVIAWQTTDPTHVPTNLTIPGPSHYVLVTKMMAAAAMEATNGKPDVGFITVPGFPIYAGTIDPEFESAMKSFCPSCKVHVYAMPIAALGKNATSLAVNFTRANPGINVLVMDQDSVSLGLKAQLQSAGLSNVKDIGLYPSAANLPNLGTGAEYALIPDPFLEMAYLDADALARIFTGQSPQEDISTTAPAAIWTKANVPSTSVLKATLPGYLALFKKLWGK